MQFHLKSNLLFSLCIICLAVASYLAAIVEFIAEPNSYFESEKVSIQTRSDVLCCTKCGFNDSCLAVNYNRQTSECELLAQNPVRRTHLARQNWTLFTRKSDCDDPEHELNAVISSGSTRIGSIRTYTCIWGYGVVNQTIDMTITCNTDATWSPALFECKEKICPENWRRNNQSCYMMNASMVIRTSAIEYCSSLDAHLVTMESEEENIYVKQLVVATYGVMSRWWLGIDDIADEGNWVYTHTNELITVTDWAQGEPGNNLLGNENCANLGYDNVAWADVPCGSSRRIICEKP